jgi:hypothetical protein
VAVGLGCFVAVGSAVAVGTAVGAGTVGIDTTKSKLAAKPQLGCLKDRHLNRHPACDGDKRDRTD